MPNHTLDGTSGKHQWLERREPHLKIESGEAVIQHPVRAVRPRYCYGRLVGQPSCGARFNILLLSTR